MAPRSRSAAHLLGVAAAWAAVLALEGAVAADMPHRQGQSAGEVIRVPWGSAAAPQTATRTVEVRMLDSMRFEPGALTVRAGETVRFTVANAGALPHEFVIGDKAELDRHAAMMRGAGGHHDGAPEHDDGGHGNHHHGAMAAAHHAHHASAVMLAPGARAELTWKFEAPGEFHFACLIPGHYEAGMVGTISVVR